MYETMKKLIEDDKIKLQNGTITPEEYNQSKAKHLKYLNAYKKGGRITISQYEELCALLEGGQGNE